MVSKLRVTILGAAVAVSAFDVGGSKGYAQVGATIAPSATFAPDLPGVTFDVNALAGKLGNTVQQAIAFGMGREACLNSLKEEAYNHTKRRYNVMVCDMANDFDDSQLNGVLSFTTHQFSGRTVGVWVLKSGTFMYKGVDDKANWIFQGHWTRAGKDRKTVVFADPTLPSPSKPRHSKAKTGQTRIHQKKGPAMRPSSQLSRSGGLKKRPSSPASRPSSAEAPGGTTNLGGDIVKNLKDGVAVDVSRAKLAIDGAAAVAMPIPGTLKAAGDDVKALSAAVKTKDDDDKAVGRDVRQVGRDFTGSGVHP